MRSVAGGVDRASLRTGAASGRRAEERLVVAVELLRALIAHGVGRGIDVSVASQQELLRFIEAKRLRRGRQPPRRRREGRASADLGIRGNSHFPFAEKNNVEVAGALEAWLKEKGLDGYAK